MAVESVAETAAEHIEEVAEVARQINTHFIQGFAAGGAVGVAIGFIFGYRFNRAKIRAEVLKEAEEDMVKVRMYYHERYESEVPPKPPLEDVVKERETWERPIPPPVPVQEPVVEKAREVQYPKVRETESVPEWDYGKEMQQRSPNHPYVIHQDEFNNNQLELQQKTWTYYAGDDILADDDDEVVVRPELVIGEANLKRFGHGSDDPDIVFVRNERVGVEFEICRSWKSYAAEVQGMDPEERALDEDQDEARS